MGRVFALFTLIKSNKSCTAPAGYVAERVPLFVEVDCDPTARNARLSGVLIALAALTGRDQVFVPPGA